MERKTTYGAKKYERINIGLKKTVMMDAIWSTILVITAFAFGPYIIKFLTGTTYLDYMYNFYS